MPEKLASPHQSPLASPKHASPAPAERHTPKTQTPEVRTPKTVPPQSAPKPEQNASSATSEPTLPAIKTSTPPAPQVPINDAPKTLEAPAEQQSSAEKHEKSVEHVGDGWSDSEHDEPPQKAEPAKPNSDANKQSTKVDDGNL